MIRVFSKANPGVRRISGSHPCDPELPGQTNRKFIGTPYLPLDPLAKWMLFISTLLAAALTCMLKGPASLLFFVMGSPIAIPIAIMIARMSTDRDIHRLVGVLYVLGLMLATIAHLRA